MIELPKLNRGYGRRGADMGRSSCGIPQGKVYLEPILDPCPAACGAYDYEGAYWGLGEMVWRGTGYDAEGDAFQFTFRSDMNPVAVKQKAAELCGDGCQFELIECQSPCRLNGGCEHCLNLDEEEL